VKEDVGYKSMAVLEFKKREMERQVEILCRIVRLDFGEGTLDYATMDRSDTLGLWLIVPSLNFSFMRGHQYTNG
jgi:hypothetical protein